MLETYPAILHDNRIEWSGEAPKPLPPGQAVRVHVTLLEPVPTSPGAAEQGRLMAEALERLAASQRLSEITDAAEWEREARQDRPLPGRDS